MRLVRQPPGSQLCGQASVATALGITLCEAVYAAGDGPLGVHSLRAAFPGCFTDVVDSDGFLRSPRANRLAVCVTFPDDAAAYGHIIAWDGQQFLDPADGYAGPMPDRDWQVRWTLEVVP